MTYNNNLGSPPEAIAVKLSAVQQLVAARLMQLIDTEGRRPNIDTESLALDFLGDIEIAVQKVWSEGIEQDG